MVTVPANGKPILSRFQRIDDPSKWQEALNMLPDPHPLQSWPWAEVKGRWGWSSTPLLLSSTGGKITRPHVAAMVLKRSVPWLPFSILYVPKGPILDYSDQDLRKEIMIGLEQLAKEQRAIFLKIDPDVIISRGIEQEKFSPLGQSFTSELSERGWRLSDDQIQFRNTVELDLTKTEDELLADMKSKTRYNIRLAERREVVVRAGTPEDWSLIAQMYTETAARDQFVIRPVAYYLDAWQSFHKAGMAQALIAEHQGDPLAAVIIIHLGEKAIYMYGASTNRERQRMPNYLLQWEAIKWAKTQGCKVYDFWGAPDQFVETDPLWGVWRFKDGFQGELVRHIGAWDYPALPFWYRIYSDIVPRYLNILRTRSSARIDKAG